MFTRHTKREAAVKIVAGEQYLTPDATVRRSSRRTVAPKRLHFSPDTTDTNVTEKKTKTEKEEPEKTRIKDEDAEAGVDQTADGHGGLSEYELERLENIRKNQAFLSSINLLQVDGPVCCNHMIPFPLCLKP
ncbi:hypothetical protein AMECASPLE_001825 [Ameca splendens]|uniref:Uncharacterized protein n=1 Tax=Ameca splendens TaxID=208324 RepID=A0ABV0YWB9_9TELE